MTQRAVCTAAALLVLVLFAGCSSPMSRGEAQDAARVNTQLGIRYAQQGQFSVALEKLQRAIEQDESLPEAHAVIAYVYQNLGERKKAERHYRLALQLDPNDPSVKNNFGVFLCESGEVDQGEKYLLVAARDSRYPTPEAAWTNAGNCIKAQNIQRAEQYFRQALQIKSDYGEALAQMARVSFVQQDYLRTRAFLQRYDLKSAATAELLYIAAATEQELGDAQTAEAFRLRLKMEFPESVEAAAISASPQ